MRRGLAGNGSQGSGTSLASADLLRASWVRGGRGIFLSTAVWENQMPTIRKPGSELWYERNSEARVFRNWKIGELTIPSDARPYFGADWGFSKDPNKRRQRQATPSTASNSGCRAADFFRIGRAGSFPQARHQTAGVGRRIFFGLDGRGFLPPSTASNSGCRAADFFRIGRARLPSYCGRYFMASHRHKALMHAGILYWMV